MRLISNPRFIVDNNVGKLARWLRMMGYNTIFFDGTDDADMISTALAEDRVIITRDTQVVIRRLVTRGRLKAVLIASDEPEQQMQQIINVLALDCHFQPFTICLECNQPLAEKEREQVKGLVPSYVYQTQRQFVQCPACLRIYWRGTHWQAMSLKLEKFTQC
ncbi:Mut7-C RNAse domain-containing protein [Chloroflexota bacterium]